MLKDFNNMGSRFVRLLGVIFGYNVEHTIFTLMEIDMNMENIWGHQVFFYEKRHEGILLQLNLWNDITLPY